MYHSCMEPRVLSGDLKKYFAKRVKVSVSGVNVPLFYDTTNNEYVKNGVILKVEKLSIEFRGNKPNRIAKSVIRKKKKE